MVSVSSSSVPRLGARRGPATPPGRKVAACRPAGLLCAQTRADNDGSAAARSEQSARGAFGAVTRAREPRTRTGAGRTGWHRGAHGGVPRWSARLSLAAPSRRVQPAKGKSWLVLAGRVAASQQPVCEMSLHAACSRPGRAPRPRPGAMSGRGRPGGAARCQHCAEQETALCQQRAAPPRHRLTRQLFCVPLPRGGASSREQPRGGALVRRHSALASAVPRCTARCIPTLLHGEHFQEYIVPWLGALSLDWE